MKIPIGKIIGTLFLCLIVSVPVPFIISPIIHNYKLYKFNRSIERIPIPIGYVKIFQEKKFGLLWANGNHGDYLVILGLTADDNERSKDEELYRGTSKNLSFLEVFLRFNLRCFYLSYYIINT